MDRKAMSVLRANARHTGHTNSEILLMGTLGSSSPFHCYGLALANGTILGL